MGTVGNIVTRHRYRRPYVDLQSLFWKELHKSFYSFLQSNPLTLHNSIALNDTSHLFLDPVGLTVSVAGQKYELGNIFKILIKILIQISSF